MRKIRKHARALGLHETLLDLTPLSEAEEKTFLAPKTTFDVETFRVEHGDWKGINRSAVEIREAFKKLKESFTLHKHSQSQLEAYAKIVGFGHMNGMGPARLKIVQRTSGEIKGYITHQIILDDPMKNLLTAEAPVATDGEKETSPNDYQPGLLKDPRDH